MLNIAGLCLDKKPVKGVGFAWAKNILVTKGFQSIANEDGCENEHNLPGIILGVITTNLGKVIMTRDGDICEIGYSEAGVYTTICKDSPIYKLLQFQWDCPIEGVFKRNWKGEIIISFWDGIKDHSNRPRLLNIDNLPFPIDGLKQFTSGDAANRMLLYPDVNHPSYFVSGSEQGGDIAAGVYYFIGQYGVSEDDDLNWMLPSHPVPIGKLSQDIFIINTDQNNDFKNSNVYQESKAGQNSGVSLKMQIQSLDTRFKYFKLAAIRKIGQVTDAIYIEKFKIDGSTIDFTWVGNFKNELNLDEVEVDTLNYTRFKTGTFNNKRLTVGNVKTEEELKFQKYVNNASVSWESVDMDNLAFANQIPEFMSQTQYKRYEYFANPGNAIRIRTPKPGEVYAIYAHLVYKSGYISDGFTLPGRAVDEIIIGATTFDEDETIINAVAAEPTQFGADETLLGTSNAAKLFHTRDTANINHPITGKYPGYWENENELYPNIDEYDGTVDYDGNPIAGGIDLRGQKVRHHKMPEISRLTGKASQNQLQKQIRLRIHNLEIPADLIDKIQGVLISYAEKDINNSIILGQTPVYRELKLGDQVAGTIISNAHARLYDTPLLATKPNINPRFIKNHYVSNNFNVNVTGILPTTNPTVRSWAGDGITDVNRYRVIKKLEYIAEDNAATIPISNNTREECIRTTFELVNTDIISHYEVKRGLGDTIDELDYPGLAHDEVKVHRFTFAVATIESMQKDIHTNFYEQKLVMASRGVHQVVAGINNNLASFTFDTFITGHSIKHNYYSAPPVTHYPCNSSWSDFLAIPANIDGDEEFTLTHILNIALGFNFRFPCYSNFNYVFNRGNDFKQIPTYKQWSCSPTDKRYLGFNPPFKYSTDIDYGLEYSAVMNVKFPDAFNPYLEFVEAHPYRVARTDITQDEGKAEAWRKFRPGEYHETDKSKGEVWKLDSLDKVLIIHKKYSLYIAMNKDKLASDLNEVYLGSGDVFDRDPQNVKPTVEGYAGNQSQWCSFVSKLGYVCVDRAEGKVFVFNGTLKEISNQLVRNWMKLNLNTQVDLDNPFTEVGLTGTFDEDFNRIVITKRDIQFNEDITYHGILDPVDDEELIGDAFLIDGTIQILVSITPIIIKGEPIGYEYEYRPIVENHLEEDVMVGDYTKRHFTISYSPDINQGEGGWVCFHDFHPNYLFQNRANMLAVVNDPGTAKIFKHNIRSLKAIYYDGIIRSSYWDIIHAEESETTKIVDSVTWQSNVQTIAIDQKKSEFYNETITHIMLYTNDQCTGVIAIDNPAWYKFIGRHLEGHWNFNKIRDMVIDKNIPILDEYMEPIAANIATKKSFYKVDEILGKFVIIRYICDNATQKDIFFHDSVANFRPDYR